MTDGMNDATFIVWLYTTLLLRQPDEAGRQYYLKTLADGHSRLDVFRSIVTSAEFFDLLCQQRFGPQTGSPFLRSAPPGHFYSPIPSVAAVERLEQQRESFEPEICAGIDLNPDRQLEVLRQLATFVKGCAFPDAPTSGWRYYADNGSFAPGDAILLAALIQWARPKRILEIGAGFSTAVMMDTIARLSLNVVVEAIDPEPARVRALLQPGDENALTLREGLVQELPLADFRRLRPNDILFVDSSHVMKLGSDVAFLMNEAFPQLAAGVLVHVHDIAWPFEYPAGHYRAGWAWNEAQALRLLLTDSRRYETVLFADFLVRARRAEVREIMPEFLRQRPAVSPDGNSACSFWFRVLPGD